MTHGQFGCAAVIAALACALLTCGLYVIIAAWPENLRKLLRIARIFYFLTAASILSAFGSLAWIVFNRQYEYEYAFEHTDNSLLLHHDLLHFWLRIAATWSGQEGSFLLWASWTAILGFVVLGKAGKYEPRVMPFYTSVLGFLSAILIKQSPFLLFLHVHPDAPGIMPDGEGLTPSLQNYWMTIHPSTIFFGFSSLAVPYSYAMAGLLWRDYRGWSARVLPYALLSSATLGLGLFMGGYWAYETQGWHGFWAWDPVENASFFPWLAVTALVHGLVVQRARGGMARTNTFLGILGFWLFLVGTFLTRSGALASKLPNGQLISVHAFDNISKSGLILMEAMLICYGLAGFGLWLWRCRSMPSRNTTGDSLLSRDFAFFLAILLMVLACIVIALGSTSPLFLSWMHRPPRAPEASLYNKVMLPLTLVAAIALGAVPWLAWRRTSSEVFLRRLMKPWIATLIFGFAMIVWVQIAQKQLFGSWDGSTYAGTMHDWIAPWVQRTAVVLLTSFAFLAALSNAILAYRILRVRPLSAGAWLAHVGIGLLIIGVVVSNTFERTKLLTLTEGDLPKSVFGYEFSYEGMTGHTPNRPPLERPLDPEYDPNNAVLIRVAPPGAANASSATQRTFVLTPRWFVPKLNVAQEAEGSLEPMIWPSVQKYIGHDLYVGLADTPSYSVHTITLKPLGHTEVGPYGVFYVKAIKRPLDYMGALIAIVKIGTKQVVYAQPGLQFLKNDNGKLIPGSHGQPLLVHVDEAVPQLTDDEGRPGAVLLRRLDAATDEAQLDLSLPDEPGIWTIPLSITYKPWVNLVWIGVLVAVFGTLMSMVRRMLEARKLKDNPPDALGVTEPEDPAAVGVAGAVPSAPRKRASR